MAYSLTLVGLWSDNQIDFVKQAALQAIDNATKVARSTNPAVNERTKPSLIILLNGVPFTMWILHEALQERYGEDAPPIWGYGTFSEVFKPEDKTAMPVLSPDRVVPGHISAVVLYLDSTKNTVCKPR